MKQEQCKKADLGVDTKKTKTMEVSKVKVINKNIKIGDKTL